MLLDGGKKSAKRKFAVACPSLSAFELILQLYSPPNPDLTLQIIQLLTCHIHHVANAIVLLTARLQISILQPHILSVMEVIILELCQCDGFCGDPTTGPLA